MLLTFAMTPISETILGLNDIDGIDVDMTQVLLGEQELVVHRPLPAAATVVNTGRVADVYDKGGAALIVLDIESSDTDGPLSTNRVAIFARGEGGFWGGRGSSTFEPAPEREPDLVVESPTLDLQALICRLSGDKNPLHADPALAVNAAFDKPILHGLCTHGIVAKSVVDLPSTATHSGSSATRRASAASCTSARRSSRRSGWRMGAPGSSPIPPSVAATCSHRRRSGPRDGRSPLGHRGRAVGPSRPGQS